MYSSPATSRPATPMAPPTHTDAAQPRQDCRLMQVKVLYAFDDEGKNNCLARCQQPLLVRTALLDPNSEIGIIELRTCVHAIVGASPELIAKLGQDYTVYASDYSEYGNPLVGQGMLSWVLASSSTVPNAVTQQGTMVTGRVCKNVFGLFSDGAKETLEVKLKLVPLPTGSQNDYLASMAKYRDANSAATENVNADAWATFARPNAGLNSTTTPALPAPYSTPAYGQYPPNIQTGMIPPPPPAPPAGSYHIFNTFMENATEGAVPPENQAASAQSEVEPRPQTPGNANQMKRSAPPRPSSRASNRGKQNSRPKAPKRAESQQDAEPSSANEGPSRKRARTTKTDWQGPSSLAQTAESLRVTASTAASIRGHIMPKPHPTASEIAAALPGERPPTPRPMPAPARRQSTLARQPSLLSSEIVPKQSEVYTPPYQHDLPQFGLTSPGGEYSSPDSTPANMPSSPPVPRNRSPSLSSPPLPRLLQDLDSGFASGPVDENCHIDDDIGGARNGELMDDAQFSALLDIGGKGHAITDVGANDQEPTNEDESSRTQIATLPEPTSILLSPLFIGPPTTSSDPLAMKPTIEPLQEKGHDKADSPALSENPASFAQERSQSWTAANSLILDSTNSLVEVRLASNKQTTRTSFKRKMAIQERLRLSIAAGEMPPFCRNCGEISTPTWRKAYITIEPGAPEDLVDQDDGFIMTDTLVKDDDGNVVSHRIVRKAPGGDDQEWEEFQLCNPCGIWLLKNKTMRPPEKWSKPREEPRTRRRSSKKPTTASSAEPADILPSDAQPSADAEANSDPAQAAVETRENSLPATSQRFNKIQRSASMTVRRTMSTGALLDEGAARAALSRAIQSSPPRCPGSRHSPIDLDVESPRPTRRLIFPSPRQHGRAKILDAPSLNDVDNIAAAAALGTPASETFSEDKENHAPPDSTDDNHMSRLFEPSEYGSLPRTPKSNQSFRMLFKTPTSSVRKLILGVNEFLSPTRTSPKKPLSAPITPTRVASASAVSGPAIGELTPWTAQLNRLISEGDIPLDDNDTTLGFDLFSDGMGMSDFNTQFDLNLNDYMNHDIDMNGAAFDIGQSQPFSLYEDPAARMSAEVEVEVEVEGLDKEGLEASIDAFLGAEKAREEQIAGVGAESAVTAPLDEPQA